MIEYLSNFDICSSTKMALSEHFTKGAPKVLAPKVLELTLSMEDYWPMSVRQIYYQCVAHLIVPNNNNEYRRVQRILKKLREEDILTWASIEDRTRRTSGKRGVENLQVFIREQMETLLNWRYYHRCHVQQQPVYIEISIEKQALAPLVEEIGWEFCTRVNTMRGRSSVTMIEQIASRFGKAMMRGQEPVLLHFGDLDPTGVAIPPQVQRDLLRVHGIDAKVILCGLTPTQCVEFNLPESIDAAKPADPNTKAWYANPMYRDRTPTELDALHPEQLQKLVKEKLLNQYDIPLMDEQRKVERQEESALKEMRKATMRFLRSEFPELMVGL